MIPSDELETQAASWLVRRDAGPLSGAELAQFEAWLDADPRHRATYVRLEQAWRRADRLGWLKPLEGPVNEDLLANSPFVRIDETPARAATRTSPAEAVLSAADMAPAPDEMPSRRPVLKMAMWLAACVAVVATSVVVWIDYSKNHWQQFATNLGRFERIELDDGSIVHLNTNSVIRVRMVSDHRYVILDKGEALFKVAHDTSRPFDVQAAGTTVRAVGTEFSVRVVEPGVATADGQKDVEVLVKEGRVAINPAPDVTPANATTASSTTHRSSTPLLSAGEAVTITAKRVEIAQVAKPEVDRKLSWVEGRLWFERQRLADVVAEFNRYNRRQLVIVDTSIADLKIGGGFEATDIDSFTAALERTLPVRVDRTNPDTVLLYGRDESRSSPND
jgi:transmembrane sensor